jgi:hypothetical protein
MSMKRGWMALLVCSVLGGLLLPVKAQGGSKPTVVLYYQEASTEGAAKAVESRFAQLATKFRSTATFERVTNPNAAKKDGVLHLPAIKVVQADGKAAILSPGQDEDASLSTLEKLLIAQAPASTPAGTAAPAPPAPAAAPAPAPEAAPVPAPAPLPQTGPDWVGLLVLGVGLLGGGLALGRLVRVRG